MELRRSLKEEESKPVPAHKLRPVGDLLGWVRFFCHFAGIVVRSHPSKAVDLWAYLATGNKSFHGINSQQAAKHTWEAATLVNKHRAFLIQLGVVESQMQKKF